MPSNWLYIDTNFPTFTGEESSEEKITTIQNYMFMLVEQLRYSLHNLDLSNMNKTAVERYETSITEPIYARIEDSEENIADLALTAEGLGLRLSNAEGNITSLTATAEGLSIQISDAEDDILQLGIRSPACSRRWTGLPCPPPTDRTVPICTSPATALSSPAPGSPSPAW